MSVNGRHKHRSTKTLVVMVWMLAIVAGGLLGGLFFASCAFTMQRPTQPPVELTSELEATLESLMATLSTPTQDPQAALVTPTHTSLPPTGTSTPTVVPTSTPAEQACAWPPERMLIVSIDALRPEAVRDEKAAPFMLELTRQAAYTWVAQTTRPSVTLPGHTSMLTGYDVPKHKADSNEWYKTPGARVLVPTIFQYASENGLATAMIAGKKHFYYFEQEEFLDYHLVNPKALDAQIADTAVEYILNNDFDLMVVHFANVDKAGHNYEWMSPQYLETVSRADTALQRVLLALRQAGRFDSTLIIVSTDHGGTGISHGDASLTTNKTIPWMILGPCVKPGYEIEEKEVQIFDTAVTALWALGLPRKDDLDGVPICEAFSSALPVDCP